MFNKFKKKSSIVAYQDVKNHSNLSQSTSMTMNKIHDSAEKPSIISEGAFLKGEMQFNGQIFLDGTFEGVLKAERVTVGKSGKFTGLIEAKSIIVFGEIKGDVFCDHLSLNEGSMINGKIQYESIKIEKGSSITGVFDAKVMTHVHG
jgi:cytoskeletal protein CcmA (bactofilin family)